MLRHLRLQTYSWKNRHILWEEQDLCLKNTKQNRKKIAVKYRKQGKIKQYYFILFFLSNRITFCTFLSLVHCFLFCSVS